MSIKNLNELKAIVNIGEFIKSYIPMKKEHGTLKGLCPFHSEKTPSFAIDERRGFFYCFGCKENGDAFTFLQKFKHIDFSEAVKEVAEFYDFELEYNGQKTQARKDFYEFYTRLNTAFKENLMSENETAAKIRTWLLKRGLDENDLKRFDIGLVMDNYKLKELIGKDTEMALQLGLLIKGQNGTYSQFANRLSFALRNSNYQIVGFSCRTHPYLNFVNSAKYINSRESFLFHKSNFLYNLHAAKTAYFSKKDEQKPFDKVLIVEGFMDSIALFKFGIKSNVAACGTAFNQTHLATLMKNDMNNFVLCFDKDEAGLKATLKTCELLFRHNFFEAEVLTLKGKFKDSGEVLEYITKEGKEFEFNEYFETHNAFEFYVRKRLENEKKARAKDAFLKALIKSIKGKNNYFLKDFCLTILEKITGFEFKQTQRVDLKAVNYDAEKVLFKSILADKKNAYIAFEMLYASFFENYKESYLKFKEKGEKDSEANALLLDESVKIVSGFDFSELCKSFKKAFLLRELERAKVERNFSLICSLQESLKKLEIPAEIF